MVFVKKKKKEEDLTDPLRPGASPGRNKGSGDPREPSTTKPKQFNIGGRNVSEREFKSAVEGAKIVAAGGIGPEEIEARKRRREGPPIEEREQVALELEKAGAFEEVGAREPDLQAPRNRIGELPVVGSSLQSIGSALSQSKFLKGFKGEKSFTGEKAFPEPDGETLREAALRQIRKDAFDEGISAGESFGTIIEGVPLLSTAATKYASGLIEDPSSNAQFVISNVEKEAQRATNLREKATSGALDPGFVLEQIRDIEENLSELEGRLKLLIITSPILQENTDNVNRMETSIKDAFDRVAAARGEAAPALAGKLTGTGRVIPSDEVLFFELKESRKRK